MAAPERRETGRGQRRHRALVEAAAQLLSERGIGAVSHRGVAQLAGLPLAATTYYFASLDDVVQQALEHLAEQWVARSRGVLEQLPQHLPDARSVAEAIVLVVVAAPADDAPAAPRDLLALYERYLEAGRHPRLRPMVQAYDEQVDALLTECLARGGLLQDRQTARLALALVDGALLRALAEGDSPHPVAVDAMETFVRLLPTSGGG